jgi:hypothetical protein
MKCAIHWWSPAARRTESCVCPPVPVDALSRMRALGLYPEPEPVRDATIERLRRMWSTPVSHLMRRG